MEYTISNHRLKATIKAKGAELCSLKDRQGREYMWQGDPAVWGRHAPVLFPMVGKLKNNRYSFQGQEYELPQHGFARDKNFDLSGLGDSFISFSLVANEETLAVYPFRFKLEISYSLEENFLHIDYKVSNLSLYPMFFSIGAHPAFLLEGERSSYSLTFSSPETASVHLLRDGNFSGETEPLLHKASILPISDGLFDNDALVFKHLSSSSIGIADAEGRQFLTVHAPGFPYMGIWSKNRTSPFVCIEPWFGLADNASHTGALEEKEGILSLEGHKHFECRHSVEVG